MLKLMIVRKTEVRLLFNNYHLHELIKQSLFFIDPETRRRTSTKMNH